MYFEGVAFFFIFATVKTVVVAQLVRASDCDSEGRGFEPPRLPKVFRVHSREIFFGHFFAIYPHSSPYMPFNKTLLQILRYH